jgi:phage terminase large subunit-like protein
MPPRPPAHVPKPYLVTPAPTNVEGAWFDWSEVERVIHFFGLLRQVTGRRWRGKSFQLLEWQVWYVIAPIFGWRDANGNRIVRTAWVEIPRKNGKSTLAAGIALYLLCADREPGAQVYAAAGTKDQARVVFGPAADMVQLSPAVRKRVDVQKSLLRYPKTGSIFRVLSADAPFQHGLDAHGVIIDEVHAHKKRDLVDVLETATGSREQPLVVFITTADAGDEFSIYAEKREYAELIASGHHKDPTFYAVIYAADPKDDWTDERTWEKANPGIDVTVKREYLRTQAEGAQVRPAFQNTFKRLHLNLRTKQTARWFDIGIWDDGDAAIDEERLKGRDCFGGLDLSATQDITALELVFPGVEQDALGPIDWVLSYFWMPEENVDHLTEYTHVPYRRWVDEGWIATTEGNAIDYDVVRDEILRLRKRFKIRSIGFDPWNAFQVAQELEAKGLEMVEIRQGFASLSPPSKEFERRLLRKRLRHGKNPVLRWMADVVEVRQDTNGNIRPVKPDRLKSSKRIDGIVAEIMAIERGMRGQKKRTGTFGSE